MVITEEINNDYTKFMKFFMTRVYGAFFPKQLPNVLAEMKESLQSSPNKSIGDWLLSGQGAVIRLYGFVHQPYRLLASMTLRVFTLELIRQRMIVENEDFLSFRKYPEIKFP